MKDRRELKKWILLFVVAFVLNLIWENFHSVLYLNYRGGEISELVLLRAALIDAVIIFIVIYLMSLMPVSFRRAWLIIFPAIIVSVVIEWWALGTGRWAYSEAMPIVPVLKTGLTPTIQLGLLSYLSYFVFKKL